MTHGRLLSGVVFALALAGCAPALPPGDPARPDLVLVSIDSLRADHLGAGGYARDTSPFLDRLARQGLQFSDARSASPWTLPSHTTMLTGLWPWEHGVVEDTLRIGEGTPLVTERLAAAGYRTAGFVSTVYVSGTYGFARGFSHWNDHGISEADNLRKSVRADAQVDEVLAWLRAQPAGAPAFVFLHLYDVHYPYACEGYDTRFDRKGRPGEAKYRTYAHYLAHPLKPGQLAHQVAQYDECIASVDDQLERLHTAWRRGGREPVFVVTADHGEEFGERGSWGHAHTLAPEQLHVPLIVSGKGIAAGVRTERVGTIDIANTLAALGGVEGFGGDGVDLRGTVPVRGFGGETARFTSARLSWETGSERLDLDLAHGTRALYDHAADPAETRDRAGSDPARADALQRELLRAVGTPWRVAVGATAHLAEPESWGGGGPAPLRNASPGANPSAPRSKGERTRVGAFWDTDGRVWGAGVACEAGRVRSQEDAETGGAGPVPDVSTQVSGLAGVPLGVDVSEPCQLGAWPADLEVRGSSPLRREPPAVATPVALPDSTREALEALGYVQ